MAAVIEARALLPQQVTGVRRWLVWWMVGWSLVACLNAVAVVFLGPFGIVAAALLAAVTVGVMTAMVRTARATRATKRNAEALLRLDDEALTFTDGLGRVQSCPRSSIRSVLKALLPGRLHDNDLLAFRGEANEVLIAIPLSLFAGSALNSIIVGLDVPVTVRSLYRAVDAGAELPGYPMASGLR